MAYFQVPWAQKRGALETFGVEAASVRFPFLPRVVLNPLQNRGIAVSPDHTNTANERAVA